jgi:RNA recognition motif-containing protein
LKEYCCLYVENINRSYSYGDIKKTFNEYGPVKNIRINIDQKTGRFMGSVLVYFDDRSKISKILETIQANPLSQQFRVLAVNSE